MDPEAMEEELKKRRKRKWKGIKRFKNLETTAAMLNERRG
jgi:hypothetical protein